MNKEAKIIKRPLVLWSGGLDSTALVIDLLHEGDIDVMYVNLDNNRRQQRYEKKAVLKLRILVADANLKGKIINEHCFGYEEIFVDKAVFAQPGLWINAAVYMVNPALHSSVNIAYVKADDIWHYKTEVINAYNALIKLVCYEDEVVPLNFRYEWSTKEDLVTNVLKDFVYFKQVMKTIRYCEDYNKEPCGNCTSCNRHNAEIGEDAKLLAIDMTAELKKFKADKAEATENEHV